MAGAIRRTVRALSGMNSASKSTTGALWLRSAVSALRCWYGFVICCLIFSASSLNSLRPSRSSCVRPTSRWTNGLKVVVRCG